MGPSSNELAASRSGMASLNAELATSHAAMAALEEDQSVFKERMAASQEEIAKLSNSLNIYKIVATSQAEAPPPTDDVKDSHDGNMSL